MNMKKIIFWVLLTKFIYLLYFIIYCIDFKLFAKVWIVKEIQLSGHIFNNFEEYYQNVLRKHEFNDDYFILVEINTDKFFWMFLMFLKWPITRNVE